MVQKDLPSYDASIYLRAESTKREKRLGPNEKKKSASSKLS
jgi:hypothetical protein